MDHGSYSRWVRRGWLWDWGVIGRALVQIWQRLIAEGGSVQLGLSGDRKMEAATQPAHNASEGTDEGHVVTRCRRRREALMVIPTCSDCDLTLTTTQFVRKPPRKKSGYHLKSSLLASLSFLFWFKIPQLWINFDLKSPFTDGDCLVNKLETRAEKSVEWVCINKRPDDQFIFQYSKYVVSPDRQYHPKASVFWRTLHLARVP